MGQIKGRANLKDRAAVHSNKWGNMNVTFWERGFSSAYKKGPGDGSQKILDFWSKLSSCILTFFLTVCSGCISILKS